MIWLLVIPMLLLLGAYILPHAKCVAQFKSIGMNKETKSIVQESWGRVRNKLQI